MPIFFPFDFLCGLGKTLYPKWQVPCGNATQIPRILLTVEIQFRASAYHQIVFGEEILGHIGFGDGKQLPTTRPHDRFQLIAGNGYVFARALRGSRTQRKIFCASRPRNIVLALIFSLPPTVHAVVIGDGHFRFKLSHCILNHKD